MKRILLGDAREPLLTTLEAVLRHWGYRVSAASSSDNLTGFLAAGSFDLLIFAGDLLQRSAPLVTAVEGCLQRCDAGLLLIEDPAASCEVPFECERIALPLNIFSFFAAVQQHLEDEPRRNLRLPLKLPGLLQIGETSEFVEILSLSIHGMFIKTPLQMEVGTSFKIVAPLIGMKREVELAARVLYRVDPVADNNYLGGFGVGFTDPGSDELALLERFLQQRFREDFRTARARLALGSGYSSRESDADEALLRLVADE